MCSSEAMKIQAGVSAKGTGVSTSVLESRADETQRQNIGIWPDALRLKEKIKEKYYEKTSSLRMQFCVNDAFRRHHLSVLETDVNNHWDKSSQDKI